MTNPNNAIGTNGAFGGRTSVNAFNDGLNAWTRGVMSGWACVPDSGMTVAIGGDPDTRDVAVAEDDAGNKTSINNISLAPVKMTIPGAPASNTRIDSIVAYVDNPPQGSADITDNYEACGIIVVSGTASASPVPPNETAIRTAITADGATGATAYYVVLANVSVANGTTDITAGEILAGDVAGLSGEGIINADNIDFTTSVDSNGWQVVQLSDNMKLYLKKGQFSASRGVQQWGESTASVAPAGLSTQNTFFGGAGGEASDHALSVCGFVDFSNATVKIQTQNVYQGGTVTSSIFWWAYIIEILN